MLDAALERLALTGPEWEDGLSNHGPMAAEALVRLGFGDAVEGWVSGYLPRLDGAPRPSDRIGSWREALGDLRRVGDWNAYFADQLASAPWREVLALWWPRLVPGMAAGATHGVIRTAHAVRAVAAAETPARLGELSRALAYWAAAYVELPGRPITLGTTPLADAVAGLPVYQGERASRITATLGRLTPDFASAVTELRPPADGLAAFHELSRTFAVVFLERGRVNTIEYIHAVTAPVAVTSILSELPRPLWGPTYAALWQVCAAIHSGYALGTTVSPLVHSPEDPADLAERAVANGDEHAIKLTEACLRSFDATADPVFLRTAELGLTLV